MNATVTEYRQRDQYGRSVLHVVGHGTTRHEVVLVTLPKTARALDPNRAYLVNDWAVRPVPGRTDAENGITYWAKRSDALAHARALAAA